MLPQVRVQYCMFVWGGHPASAAYPDKDRRPIRGFSLAESNIVHLWKEQGPQWVLSHLEIRRAEVSGKQREE